MANPLYGQNKADAFIDGQEKIVRVNFAPIAIVATTHAAGDHGFAWKNPEGEDIMVTDFILDVTTAATGAATMDIGVAANGTTGSDTLLDGVDVGTAAILASADVNGGTNGLGAVKMSSTQYITADASASVAGLIGSFYVKYFVISKV